MRHLAPAARFAALLAFVPLVSGCSAGSRDAALPLADRSASASARGYMSPAVSQKSSQLLYLSAFVAGKVYVYAQSGKNQAPAGEIDGLVAPTGLAVSSKGDLYVASRSNGTVSAFHKGATTPFAVFGGGSSLQGVAVDAKGTVYANSGFSNQIYVWANGSTSPTQTLTAAFSDDCGYIALDAKGDLFVDSLFGEFDEFPAGSTTPVALFSTNTFTAPFGIAVDRKGDLVTAFSDGNVAIYPPPYNGSTRGTFTYTGLIYAIALTKSGTALWAGNMNGANGTVGQAYAVPGGKLLDTTSGTDISGDSILGVATYPPAKL